MSFACMLLRTVKSNLKDTRILENSLFQTVMKGSGWSMESLHGGTVHWDTWCQRHGFVIFWDWESGDIVV